MKNKNITAEQVSSGDEQLRQMQSEIEYDTKDYTLELLVQKFQREDFFIPPYQRGFVWEQADKTRFVESVLLGLPIPFMFFASCDDGRLEIIDGVQRMQTLSAFINNKFTLSKLEKLNLLENFYFKNFSESTRRKFLNRTLRIVVLAERSSNNVRQDLFNRINTTGMKATPSEIRRGSYFGPLKTLIEKLCENDLFIKLCPMTNKKIVRQERFEFILRFFAYLYNYQSFEHDVKNFLDKFLSDNLNICNIDKYESDFITMLTFVDKFFPFGFAKSKNARTTPRVRFEAISVGVALALNEKSNLVVDNIDWINSNDFKNHTTSDASNNQGKLAARIEYVRNMLLGK